MIISSLFVAGYLLRYFQYNNLLNEKNNLENSLYLYNQEKLNLEDKIKITERSIVLEKDLISELQDNISRRKESITTLETQISSYEKLRKYDMTVFITPDNEKVRIVAETMNTNDPVQIYEYVRDEINYVEDYTTHEYRFEYWQFPEETLNLGTGDCEDQAILLCTLFRAKGYSPEEVKVVFGLTSSINGHAWVELLYNEKWVVFDPTSNARNYIEKTQYYSISNITYKGSFNDIHYELAE